MNQEFDASQMGQWKSKENHHHGDTKRLTALFDGEVNLVDILFANEEVKPVLTPEQQGFISELQTTILAARKTMVENQQQTTIEMPASAGSFDIVDSQRNISFTMPDFNSLLIQYSDSLFYATVEDILKSLRRAIINSKTLRPLPDEERKSKALSYRQWDEANVEAWLLSRLTKEAAEMPLGVTQSKETYKTFSEEVVPELRECVNKINSLAEKDVKRQTYKGECFIGHGADALYWATTASRWKSKLAELTRPVKVNIGTAFLKKDPRGRYTDQLDPSSQSSIVRMLERLGVQADSQFFDTGFYGSVPAALIRALDPQMQMVPPEKVNEHIKLMRKNKKGESRGVSRIAFELMQAMAGFGDNQMTLGRNTKGIVMLGSQTPQGLHVMRDILEGDTSPRAYRSPTTMSDDQPKQVHTSAAEQIRAYGAQQAVMREFLPRSVSQLGEMSQLEQRIQKLKVGLVSAFRPIPQSS